MIPGGSKRCPECGAGQSLAGQGDEFSFTRPEDLGVSSEPSVDNYFMDDRVQTKKAKNACPACGTPMQFKERVNSYFCPKCRSFY